MESPGALSVFSRSQSALLLEEDASGNLCVQFQHILVTVMKSTVHVCMFFAAPVTFPKQQCKAFETAAIEDP